MGSEFSGKQNFLREKNLRAKFGKYYFRLDQTRFSY